MGVCVKEALKNKQIINKIKNSFLKRNRFKPCQTRHIFGLAHTYNGA